MRRLIVFIHGLGGSPERSWGRFPDLIATDPEFALDYETYMHNYGSCLLRLPFTAKPPSIHTLARGLRTEIDLRYGEAEEITLVGHSLGGLIARQYLLEQVKSGRHTAARRLLMFATPNNGSELARAARKISCAHRQLKALCRGSEFLGAINDDWVDLDMGRRFAIQYVVAGSDTVVDEVSARHFWGTSHFEVVSGASHRSVIKPSKHSDLAYVIFKKFVTGELPSLLGPPIRADWSAGWPTPKVLLDDAQDWLLLLGTSLSRVMHGDLFMYRDWLSANDARSMGLLFLNPHGPHAIGRSREGVQRSSAEEIVRSVGVALKEETKNKRFKVALYEGPFRYAARASGGSRDGGKGSVGIVTSSHSQGTSGGFYVSLSRDGNAGAYKFYRNEILEFWMKAQANRPGHGLSLVYCEPSREVHDVIGEQGANLPKNLAGRGNDIHVFSPEQHHVSVASLCRTRDALQPALCRAKAPEEASLPWHYGEFLRDATEIAQESMPVEHVFHLDQVTLDLSGHVRLEKMSRSATEFTSVVERLWQRIDEKIGEYAERHPDEGWLLGSDGGAGRFQRRYATYIPHVTIGVAFRNRAHLPEIIRGRSVSMPLSNPIEIRATRLAVVHYAYRSFLRRVGELLVPKAGDALPESGTILQELGVCGK
jgi:predicted alpha/beta hydrolase family esterase